jgi:2-desacetyl-2-hydroxyethyl bacteriochlorophyllide A dehydrogenase
MNIQKILIQAERQAACVTGELTPRLEPHELLIQTECSFISAGTELAIYTALDPNVRVPGAWCAYPWLAGYANVGRVIEAGVAAPLKAGARVFSMGPHASTFIYDSRKLVAEIPETADAGEVAALRMAHVALTALDVAEPGYNRWVAVFGLGMVGNLAAQLFRLRGAQVIGIDPSPKRRALAEACGVPYTLVAADEAAIRAITNGVLVDTAVDAVGNARVVAQAASLTANFGEVILLGSPRSKVEGDLNDLLYHVHYRWVSFKGALEWRVPAYPQLPNEHSQLKKHQALTRWLADGALKLSPLISHRLPPTKIREAYEGLLGDKDRYIGVVLDWQAQ